MSDKIKMRDGDTMLIMVKDGEVIHFTPNMSLPHSEFVKRAAGQLPAGAWVGTVSKLEGESWPSRRNIFSAISFPPHRTLRRRFGRGLSDEAPLRCSLGA